MRIIKLGVCAAVFTAFSAFSAAPAQAASLVTCESEGGYWDCYLPSGYSSQKWYYDGVYQPGFDNSPSAGGSCTPGSRHHVRVTFSGGSSTTNFTCH